MFCRLLLSQQKQRRRRSFLWQSLDKAGQALLQMSTPSLWSLRQSEGHREILVLVLIAIDSGCDQTGEGNNWGVCQDGGCEDSSLTVVPISCSSITRMTCETSLSLSHLYTRMAMRASLWTRERIETASGFVSLHDCHRLCMRCSWRACTRQAAGNGNTCAMANELMPRFDFRFPFCIIASLSPDHEGGDDTACRM